MAIDLLVIVGAGLLAGLANVFLGALLQHMPVGEFVRTFTRMDLVGLTFASIGVSSLALSYTRGLWVQGPRAAWWEAFHLELGAAFVVLGAVETLVMARLPTDDRAGRPPSASGR